MNSISKGAKIALTLVVALTFLSGTFYSGYVSGRTQEADAALLQKTVNQEKGRPKTVDFALFWKVWNLLDEKFVSTASSSQNTNAEDRVYGAIKGMVAPSVCN